MSLSAETCLRGVIEALQNRISPSLSDRFAGEVARLASLVLTITANGIDDAAAVRVAENSCIRTLFQEVEGFVSEIGLASRLQQAWRAPASGLKLSELDDENARLRALLVELHVNAEGQPGDHARAICSRIWRMLADFEAARAPRR